MTIEEIKQKLNINTVLEHYGLKAKNGMLCCPFHADKTPSMQYLQIAIALGVTAGSAHRAIR